MRAKNSANNPDLYEFIPVMIAPLSNKGYEIKMWLPVPVNMCFYP
nr:MAG TPA: hypothetical protein [Caudoviricetes sp.]